MYEKFITLGQERLHAERVKNFIDRLNDENALVAALLEGIDSRITNISDTLDGLSIPTNISELTNDSKYQTDNDVATAIANFDFSTISMPIGANKNLFRNGNLINPINQRGKNSYTGIGYGFDGWHAYHDNTTVAKSNDGVVVTNSSNSLHAVIGQIVPTSDLILGEYTLSALSTGGFNNVEVWSGSRKFFETPSDRFFSKKIKIDSTWTHSQIQFNFYMKPGSTFIGAKLERGGYQTAVYKDTYGNYEWFDSTDITEELKRCQSVLFVPTNNISNTGPLSMGLSYNNIVQFFLPNPSGMKGKPRLKAQGGFEIRGPKVNRLAFDVENVILNPTQWSSICFDFDCGPFPGYTLDNYVAYQLFARSDRAEQPYIEYSTELLPA